MSAAKLAKDQMDIANKARAANSELHRLQHEVDQLQRQIKELTDQISDSVRLRPLTELDLDDVDSTPLVYVEDFATTNCDAEDIKDWLADGWTVHGWLPLPEARS